MRWSRAAAVVLASTWLSGCGSYVPDLREWPNNVGETPNQLMIQSIVKSVRCELRNAVTRVIDADNELARLRRSKRAYSDFLYGWGAEVLLTLTIKEASGLGVSAVGAPPSPADSIFTIAGGLGVSGTAVRIEKLNFFYTVQGLYLGDGQVCDASGEDRNDSLLVGNDLKIATILDAKITAAALGNAGTPAPGRGDKPTPSSEPPYKGEKNVISHEVSFEVISTGNLTPAWRLTRATVNPVAPFLSGNRDRTHDLLVTFGPLDKASGGRSLIPIAEQTHFSSQITSGFMNGMNYYSNRF